MSIRSYSFRVAAAFVLLVFPVGKTAVGAGLENATVLIIRHAEKPTEGNGLTPAGEARAKAYVEYFKNLKSDAKPLKPDAIFATADSKNSRRPQITVEPLAQSLGLTVNVNYKDKDFPMLVNDLRAHAAGKTVLVCWHHGVLPEMLRELGADPGTLLPGGQWPADEYGWLLVLRYDAEGKLLDAKRVVEGL